MNQTITPLVTLIVTKSDEVNAGATTAAVTAAASSPAPICRRMIMTQRRAFPTFAIKLPIP